MLKKSVLMAVAILLGLSVGTVQGKDLSQPMVPGGGDIYALYDGRRIVADEKPRMVNNQVLIELRSVLNALKASFSLDGKNITIKKRSTTVRLQIGTKSATVNGQTLTLGLAAEAVNGRTLVPLRFVSVALGEKVEWDAVTRFVWIGEKAIPELEDIVQPTSLAPYMHYLKGAEYILDIEYENQPIVADKALIVDESMFPFTIRGEAFYRWDLAYQKDGTVYIKATTTDKGTMATQLYYLENETRLRYRPSTVSYQENIGDFRIHYYREVRSSDEKFDKNYRDYKIKQADYIGINSDYLGLILVKNPLK